MKKWIGVFVCILLLVGCQSGQVETMKENTTEKQEQVSEQSSETAKGEQENGESKKNDEKIEGIKEEEETESSKAQQLNDYIEQMTIEEKVGQLLMIALRQDEKGNPITICGEAERGCIEKYHVGGVILFSENIEGTDQVKSLISDFQGAAKVPLFIGVDEEGGMVSRVGSNKAINDVPFKEAYAIGQSGDTDIAYQEAQRMGKLLKALGFNMDFAPDADIYNEPQNTVIGRRSFGKDSQTVTPMVIAFAKGLKEEGILPVVKHFPGHGNTMQDSHSGLAYVDKSLTVLEGEELVPFMTVVSEEAAEVMKGHLIVSDVDAVYPASLSSGWQAYLESKADLSHTLLITDALNMGAIAQHYSSSEAALLAVEAGDDILLMPENVEEAYNGLLMAVESGRLKEERIDQSVYKILSKKIAQNLLVLS